MAMSGLLNISLARKCQILFGLAVLLIIGSALFVPGRYMETLVHEMNARQARHLAVLAHARIDPLNSDWQGQQASLNQWWTDYAKTLKLPTQSEPRLIPLPYGTIGTGIPNFRVLIERIRAPFTHLQPCIHWISRRINPPPKWRLASAAWQFLSEHVDLPLFSHGRAVLQQVAQAYIAANGPPLDDFLTQCIQEMQADPQTNEKRRVIHLAGQPTTYEYVLAIRPLEATPNTRPLIGIINVKLTSPRTDRILLWTRVILALAGVLAGFLAILVFYLISQKLILAPVRELKALIVRIAGGDLSARSAIDTGDEFQELSDAFNNMLSQLEGSRIELEKINRSLDTRLGELAETNVALYESNRLKSEFLANVSHELRTPLTSIIGFADLLRDVTHGGVQADTSRITRYAHNILTSGRMLLDLINDLLDLAKIEAGKVELHRTKFAPRDVCEALSDFIQPMVDKKELSLSVDLDDHLPMMNSDAGKLRQVLYNLLSNAIKYTPAGGTVSLEARTLDHDTRIHVEVADTGPGISPEDQERIFEKFRQLDSSVTREHTGSGLGLAISRELTHMLGGTIRLESELGKGARFIVELPVECPEIAYRPMSPVT